ncbi:MAG: SsrA-binding protein SmpB [Candidatus Promineifilaceae bacterium]
MKKTGIKLIAQNRKARHDYEFLDVYEAGLVLKGTEIKSIRDKKANIQQAYVRPIKNELWLIGANIAEYTHGNRENHEPTRSRKLLLHRKEITKIIGKTRNSGITIVPVKLYLKEGRAKLEIAIGRGKQKQDKRQDLAKKDARRNIERSLKGRY